MQADLRVDQLLINATGGGDQIQQGEILIQQRIGAGVVHTAEQAGGVAAALAGGKLHLHRGRNLGIGGLHRLAGKFGRQAADLYLSDIGQE